MSCSAKISINKDKISELSARHKNQIDDLIIMLDNDTKNMVEKCIQDKDPQTPWTVDYLSKHSIMYITDGYDIVSFVIYKITDLKFVSIDLVFTKLEFRSRGYAKNMFYQLIREYSPMYYLYELHVLDKNKPAIALYESVGFKTCSRWMGM